MSANQVNNLFQGEIDLFRKKHAVHEYEANTRY